MQKKLITDFQTLKNYGYSYYLAYIPSLKKLEEKLLEKSENQELTGKVLTDLKLYIDEEKNILNYINYFKTRNKNLPYIKQKLTEKKFKKEDIEKSLQENIESTGETILNPDYLKRKFFDLKEKGKSKNYIRQKFIGRKEDREVVEQCLNEVFSDDENTGLKKTLGKILKGKEITTLSYDEKNKIRQKLLMAGFEYDEIKNLLR